MPIPLSLHQHAERYNKTLEDVGSMHLCMTDECLHLCAVECFAKASIDILCVLHRVIGYCM